MTNGTFSRLALLGLAVVASTTFAATTISGNFRLDATYPDLNVESSGVTESTEYDDKDYFDLTRARINISGDIAQDFTYFVRLDATEGFGTTPPNSHAVSVSQAYPTWHGMDNMQLNIGKTPGPFFSADEYYYKPYIVHDENTQTALGVVKEKNGNHAGIDLNGSISMLSYSVGLWKESDVSAYKTGTNSLVEYTASSTNSAAGSRLRFGYGFRAAITPIDSDKMQVGVGVGFSNTPVSQMVGMTGSTTSSGTATTHTFYTSFDQKTDFTVDACAVMGALQVNAGYFHQKISDDLTYGTEVTSTTTNATYINDLFNDNAKHTGYYGEVGYLIMGDGYKYDSSKAAVSGVKVQDDKSALELVLRMGTQTREDAIAWMYYNSSETGAVYDNTSSTNRKTENDLRIRHQGFNVNVNYCQ